MKDYLRYLNHHDTYQPFYNSLQQVGGYDAALSGTDDFKSAWKELSKNKDFLQSQNDFIIDKKLTPTLRRISDIKGLDLDNRSPVIRDVLYSTATQHGDGGAAHVYTIVLELMQIFHLSVIKKSLNKFMMNGVM